MDWRLIKLIHCVQSGRGFVSPTNAVVNDLDAKLLVQGKLIYEDYAGDFHIQTHILGERFTIYNAIRCRPSSYLEKVIINTSNGYNLLVDIWSLGCSIYEMAKTKPPWYRYERAAALYKSFNVTQNRLIGFYVAMARNNVAKWSTYRKEDVNGEMKFVLQISFS